MLACAGIYSVTSYFLTPLISTLLFGVRPSDPVTLLVSVSCLFISGSGSAACFVQPGALLRVDPLAALGYE